MPYCFKRALLLGRRVAEDAADARAATEQVRRLAADDVEVLVLADHHLALLRELIQLAFDHPQRDVAELPHDVEPVGRQRQAHRLDVEVVAQQNGDVAAPPRMHRRLPAAPLRVVDDVVVHQGGGVDELDDRGVEDGELARVARQTRCHQQHGRPNALAPAVLDVSPDLRDEVDLRFDVPVELCLDLLQVFPDRLEHLDESGV